MKEEHLWRSLKLACVKPPTGMQIKHLRRAWRSAEKFGVTDEEGEEEEEEAAEEEEEGQGEEEKANKPPEDGATKVTIESFFEGLQGDEYLSKTLFQEAEIPVKDPQAEAEEGEEEEEGEED